MSYTLTLQGKRSELTPELEDEIHRAIALATPALLSGCEIIRSKRDVESWWPAALAGAIAAGEATSSDFEVFCKTNHLTVDLESRDSVTEFVHERWGRPLYSFNMPPPDTRTADFARARQALIRIAAKFRLRLDDPQVGGEVRILHLKGAPSQLTGELAAELRGHLGSPAAVQNLSSCRCETVAVEHDPGWYALADLTEAIAAGITTQAEFVEYCKSHNLEADARLRHSVTAFLETRLGRVLYLFQLLSPDVYPGAFKRARHELIATAFKFRLRLFDSASGHEIDVP